MPDPQVEGDSIGVLAKEAIPVKTPIRNTVMTKVELVMACH